MTSDSRPRPDTDDPRKSSRLAADLRTAIEDGELAPGQPVPAIPELIRAGYAGARQTCGRALRVQEEEGLLTRYPGLGYYVRGQ